MRVVLACATAAAASCAKHRDEPCRVTNLKLGTKHGGPVWKAHNAHTDALLKDCERRLHATAERITKINQRRKLQQDKARAELDRYAGEYERVLKKNVEIEVACQKLEGEIEASGSRAANGANGEGHADGAQGGGSRGKHAAAGTGENGAAAGGEAAGGDAMDAD